jgi:hypothetical protein
VLIDRTFTSLRTLAVGYAFGLAFAAVFPTIAVASGVGTRILSTLTAMFNPCRRSPFAAGADLVRSGTRHSCSSLPFRTVGGGAQYPQRIPQRARNALRMSGRNAGADRRALSSASF